MEHRPGRKIVAVSRGSTVASNSEYMQWSSICFTEQQCKITLSTKNVWIPGLISIDFGDFSLFTSLFEKNQDFQHLKFRPKYSATRLFLSSLFSV